MSRTRFAPITSNLLVRKGEAKPWTMPESGILDFSPQSRDAGDRIDTLVRPARDEAFKSWKPAAPRPVAAHGGDGGSDGFTKRCTIRLTHAEYERIGIIAVKKEITRQQVLRQAIEDYLAAAGREYLAQCGCLGGSCRGDC